MAEFHSRGNQQPDPVSPRSRAYEQGKYGRLFPWLSPQSYDPLKDEEYFRQIAAAMFGTKNKEDVAPAGYTYFGQFIAHDLTFDPTSIGERQVDPESLWNFRTPALDLDTVYGSGPFTSPVYYKYDKSNIRTVFSFYKIKNFYDLPRTTTEDNERLDAIIPDPRNDENIIISQLHLAFMKLHNTLYEQILPNKDEATPEKKSEAFYKAQQMVRWRFQYVVIHDYLKTIIDGKNVVEQPSKIVDGILSNTSELKYFDWRNEPFVPLEFSNAIFRFGHSQIKIFYNFNQDTRDKPLFSPRSNEKEPYTYIDWSKFFFKVGPDQPLDGNLSGGISNLISIELKNVLPDATTTSEKNLAYRNLMKGLIMKLPSGQNVARAMGLPPIEGNESIRIMKAGGISDSTLLNYYKDNTPLWYYILMEGMQNDGQRLGAVGGKLLGEVIIGIIRGDKTSYLNHFPNWKPTYPDGTEYPDYSIVDLLTEAGVFNGAIAA